MKNGEVVNFYNQFLDTLKKDQHRENPRHKYIKASLQNFFGNGESVLDLGCGIGITTSFLRQIGCDATGVDIAPELIEHAEASYGGEFICHDILNLGLDRKFDAITLIDCLEHLPPDQYHDIFKTIDRHSKEDTRVYINLPFSIYQDYVKQHRPDLLQIIDEPIPSANLIKSMSDIGFEPLYLNNYGLDFDKLQYVEILFQRISQATKDNTWGSLRKATTVSNEKPLIGFWAGDCNNFWFLDPIIDRLSTDFRIKKFIYHEGDIAGLEQGLKECNLAWFEWANGPIMPATHLQGIDTPIVCRLHRYEAYTNAPELINWPRVNKLIFISESVRESFKNRFPGQYESVDNAVVRNAVDLERFSADLSHPRGKKVAYVGRFHYHKNPSMLLQCFSALLQKDPEYEIHVAGRFCDPVIEEYFWHQVNKLGIKKQITYHGEIDNVNKWLADKDFLLLSSMIEGQPVIALEAMAEGIKPVIHNYFMAEKVFPKKYLFNTIEECIDKITCEDFNRQEYRAYVEKHNDLLKQTTKIKRVLTNILDHHQNTSNPTITNSLDDWDVLISNNRFIKDDDIAIFQQCLKQTHADIIKIPVVYPLIENHEIARWEIAATRKAPKLGIQEDLYCKAICEEEISLPYNKALELFYQRRFEEALNSFATLYKETTIPAEKAVYIRWVVLCLIETGNDMQAIAILDDALQVHDDNADLYYMSLIVNILSNKIEGIEVLAEKIFSLGEARSYPEYICDIETKVLELIRAAEAQPASA